MTSKFKKFCPRGWSWFQLRHLLEYIFYKTLEKGAYLSLKKRQNVVILLFKINLDKLRKSRKKKKGKIIPCIWLMWPLRILRHAVACGPLEPNVAAAAWLYLMRPYDFKIKPLAGIFFFFKFSSRFLVSQCIFS